MVRTERTRPNRMPPTFAHCPTNAKKKPPHTTARHADRNDMATGRASTMVWRIQSNKEHSSLRGSRCHIAKAAVARSDGSKPPPVKIFPWTPNRKSDSFCKAMAKSAPRTFRRTKPIFRPAPTQRRTAKNSKTDKNHFFNRLPAGKVKKWNNKKQLLEDKTTPGPVIVKKN